MADGGGIEVVAGPDVGLDQWQAEVDAQPDPIGPRSDVVLNGVLAVADLGRTSASPTVIWSLPTGRDAVSALRMSRRGSPAGVPVEAAGSVGRMKGADHLAPQPAELTTRLRRRVGVLPGSSFNDWESVVRQWSAATAVVAGVLSAICE